MVSLDAVKQSNADLKDYGPGLVGVFVGGTSGIGEATARSFVKYAIAPIVYLIGRNETQAAEIIEDLQTLNPESRVSFVQCDVSLLRRVDEACRTIQEKEDKVNVLVLSSGIFTTKGRDETSEGLDKKLTLHYYARMRFISNLLPQLISAGTWLNGLVAGKSRGLASVVSVLEAGGEGPLILEDLALKENYSLKNCAKHAITMTSLSLEELAKANPAISFVHTYPGVVRTGLLRDFNPVTQFLMNVLLFIAKPWTVPLEDCGERHLFAATGVPRARTIGEGSGRPYLVSWDGEPRGNQNVLGLYREKKIGPVVWKHTQDVFRRICS
ncbi:hypothetical protein BJX68DRAFT_52840 [Aspergillus pseudodeflectus]|uniref:Short-chain dehydrogenase/reductase n=1 Tax=Aspergillus pseudodeflectus TaxID=176178 RepID=A0ABR4KLL9_9EURO